MSILRCEKHDRHYDTDLRESCPVCLEEGWNKEALEHEDALRRNVKYIKDRDELAAMLKRYIAAYPAFRIKPIGAPNSPARQEQERLMQLEEAALALLKPSPPVPSAPGDVVVPRIATPEIIDAISSSIAEDLPSKDIWANALLKAARPTASGALPGDDNTKEADRR